MEISVAMFAGALVGLGSVARLWLFGTLATPPREWWAPVFHTRQPVAVAAGMLAMLWWLLRARRRGL